MADQSPSRASQASTARYSGTTIAASVAVALALGAGAVAPFAISYKNNLERTRIESEQRAAALEQAKNDAVALEKQKGELRENLGQAEKTIGTLREDLTARSTALDSLKQQDDVKSAQIKSLRDEIQQRSAAMDDLGDRLKAARAEVDSSTKANTELTTMVNGLRGEVSRMSEQVQEQTVHIAKLVDEVKQEQQAKIAAQQEAAKQTQRAEVAETQVVQAHQEIMTMAPVRIEERRSTQKGRHLGEKSGVPFAAALDPVGDLFQGIGEGLFGKKGPVIQVAVFKDGHEELMTQDDVQKWAGRGVQVQRLASAE